MRRLKKQLPWQNIVHYLIIQKHKTMNFKFESIDAMYRNAVRYSLLFFIVALASCSSDDDEKPAAKIKLATSTTLGSYLTDSEGNTLYYFTRDAAGTNTCTGGCASVWPIYYEANLTQDLLGEGLSLADFGTITTAGGAQQTTYKSWPLYYYAPSVNGVFTRELPGETKGEAVGNVWFVAKPDYTIMLVNAQLVGADGKSYKGDYTEGTETVQYFTDAMGRTLYSFVVDKKNDNNFTTGDAAHDAAWPIYAETLTSVPSTLDKSLFGTIDVTGKKQLTYKGWPIYYFGADTKRGDNKGVSVPNPGVWPVVVKDTEAAPE
jgi:predicted lipoprotein with Yx(FWY)xxD motif